MLRLSIDEARTVVVNTIVVLEIFYLFGMQYRGAMAFTWSRVLGTPAILIAVGFTAAAQFLFTYAPVMQTIFATRAISVADGLLVVGTGVAFLLVLETEKLVLRRLYRRHPLAGITA